MLTLMDINRALDRLGVEAFIPRTYRPRLAVVGAVAAPFPRRGRTVTIPRGEVEDGMTVAALPESILHVADSQ